MNKIIIQRKGAYVKALQKKRIAAARIFELRRILKCSVSDAVFLRNAL